MRVSVLRIRNFRSIKYLDLTLGYTTLLIGSNDSGKTAILDALRLVLNRRWGHFSTRFHEDDVHRPNPTANPRTCEPVSITVELRETHDKRWSDAIHIALDDVIVDTDNDASAIILRVRVPWDEQNMEYQPVWEFLNDNYDVFPVPNLRRNLHRLDEFLPSYAVPALRNPRTEFTFRSSSWMRLLTSIRFSSAFETDLMSRLEQLDQLIFSSDVRFSRYLKILARATQVVMSDGPGEAQLSTMPMSVEDLLRQTTVIMRSESTQPWLPLSRHGQGLQSMAVLFLFQLLLIENIESQSREGIAGILSIEEPEAHLHPHAIRSLWDHLDAINCQLIVTTHSPFLIQRTDLTDLRVIRLEPRGTAAYRLKQKSTSKIQWKDSFESIREKKRSGPIFFNNRGFLASKSAFSDKVLDRIRNQCGSDILTQDIRQELTKLWRNSKTLIDPIRLQRYLALGTPILGESLFARRWILVEGPTDRLLLAAIGRGLGRPLDRYGIAVIELQGDIVSPSVPVAIAEAFAIDWVLIVDDDDGGDDISKHLKSRGFSDQVLGDRMYRHQSGDLEAELVECGNDELLSNIMSTITGHSRVFGSTRELARTLRKHKSEYMSHLVLQVEAKLEVAEMMPRQFVSWIRKWTERTNDSDA